MARHKRQSNGGSGRGKHSSPRVRGKLQDSFVRDAQRSDDARPHYSLGDEARNTERHSRAFLDPSVKLRYKNVAFVRASDSPVNKENVDSLDDQAQVEPAKSSPAKLSPAKLSPAKSSPALSLDGADDVASSSSSEDVNVTTGDELPSTAPVAGVINLTLNPASADPASDSAGLPFVIDTTGSSSIPQPRSFPNPVIPDRTVPRKPSTPRQLRRQTSSGSSSSEEVVFKGRAKVTTITDNPVPKAPKAPSHQPTVEDDLVDLVNNALRQPPVKNEPKKPDWDNSSVPWVSRSQPGVGWSDTHGGQSVKDQKQKQKETKKTKWQKRQEEEDAALADYMENLRTQEESEDATEDAKGSHDPLAFLRKDIALEDSNDWVPDAGSKSATVGKSVLVRSDSWDEGMLDAFDDASTSEGLEALVERILSSRERPSGVQYLVSYEGYTVDDARWVSEVALTTEREIELIQAYQVALTELINAEEEEEDGDSSDDYEDMDEDDEDEDDDEDDDDDDDEEEDFEDNEDLFVRKIERMTDEKIAAILAKQEELGLGSDEILLFDEDDDDEPLDTPARRKRIQNAAEGSKRGKRKARRGTGDFPSASLFADVLDQDPYNGFDIMDFERPSLKKKGKGRRGQLPFELSDDELAESLQTAWAADRSKKAQKKREREELRAQGMLGKRNRFKPDLKSKYKGGMGMDELKVELRIFLGSTRESQGLPPMDKETRKIVHEFASAFNLTSKSTGSGRSRFPTLIKNSRTLEFDDVVFKRVEDRVNRRFFKRSDLPRGKRITRATGGAAMSAVSYRDGDIVGFGAAEIGTENKGRALLEKMGWKSGMALGAVHNKGILQPVSHVVKTTKAGLG